MYIPNHICSCMSYLLTDRFPKSNQYQSQSTPIKNGPIKSSHQFFNFYKASPTGSPRTSGTRKRRPKNAARKNDDGPGYLFNSIQRVHSAQISGKATRKQLECSLREDGRIILGEMRRRKGNLWWFRFPSLWIATPGWGEQADFNWWNFHSISWWSHRWLGHCLK